VAHTVPGLVVVAGGKYTTYRVMAKDAVDAAVHGLHIKVPPSVTEKVPLLGADGYEALKNAAPLLAQQYGVHEARILHLLGRYGSLIHEVLELVVADPTLGEPLAGAPDYLRAEIVYAASHEGARHLDDFLARRTRISIETFDRGVGAVEEIARLVAPVLDWSDAQIEREVEHYRKRVEAERESQKMPDDETADAARMGAPEVVPVV
jgi:glycerol-3-phosphate dehydrogenase